ncbi:MAG TPA: DUF5684 domain-containing protein [Candidatus Acidoferrales bacterium]|nr:DUF5684 domain-containing protein [Candidatus Acidoferrales bacterium]
MSMQARRPSLVPVVSLLTPAAICLAPGLAFAQDERAAWAIFGAFFYFILMFALAFYVYAALALQVIADKTRTPNGWMAWIPIINLYLMTQIAKKPGWWVLLCFIPLVNIIITVLLWVGVAEARQKPGWWGILILVPIANLIVPGYLAWSD